VKSEKFNFAIISSKFSGIQLRITNYELRITNYELRILLLINKQRVTR